MVFRLLLLMTALLVANSLAQTVLQGEVEQKVWTVTDARQEVLQDALQQVNLDNSSPFDQNHTLNLKLVQKGGGIERLKDGGYKQLTVFSHGIYAVAVYTKDQYEKRTSYPPAFYYDLKGKLVTVAFRVGKESPTKLYAHCYGDYCREQNLPNGSLIWQSVEVNEGESFMFDRYGTLSGRWRGANCYREDGTNCGSRKTYVTVH